MLTLGTFALRTWDVIVSNTNRLLPVTTLLFLSPILWFFVYLPWTIKALSCISLGVLSSKVVAILLHHKLSFFLRDWRLHPDLHLAPGHGAQLAEETQEISLEYLKVNGLLAETRGNSPSVREQYLDLLQELLKSSGVKVSCHAFKDLFSLVGKHR